MREIPVLYLANINSVELISDLVFAIIVNTYMEDDGLPYEPSINTFIKDLIPRSDISSYLIERVSIMIKQQLNNELLLTSHIGLEELEADDEFITLVLHSELKYTS